MNTNDRNDSVEPHSNTVHATISHTHIVPRYMQPTDHNITTEPCQHSEMRHRVDFEDLEMSTTTRLRWTANLFSFLFSSTRAL